MFIALYTAQLGIAVRTRRAVIRMVTCALNANVLGATNAVIAAFTACSAISRIGLQIWIVDALTILASIGGATLPIIAVSIAAQIFANADTKAILLAHRAVSGRQY